MSCHLKDGIFSIIIANIIIIIIDEDNNNETHIISNVTQDIRNINIMNGEEIKKLFINCN